MTYRLFPALVALSGLALSFSGCGGGASNNPPGDNQQAPRPAVMDAGVVFGGASGENFVPFSAREGVPPITQNADIAIRALIANDTFGQPIQRVWMTIPSVPEFTQTLTFQPSASPSQAAFTYTTGTLQLPLGAGSHRVVLHALDSGNDEGAADYTVQIITPSGE